MIIIIDFVAISSFFQLANPQFIWKVAFLLSMSMTCIYVKFVGLIAVIL